MKIKSLNPIRKGSLLLLLGLVTASGCYDRGYHRNTPYYQRTYQPVTVYQSPPYVVYYEDEERAAYRENARTSPLIFENARRVERHIREETRGANFNNPREAREAAIRASQIREREWNRQTQRWNSELERRGYRRVYPGR